MVLARIRTPLPGRSNGGHCRFDREVEARAAARETRDVEARREAARAAANLAELLQRLCSFALGLGENDPAATRALTHELTPGAYPSNGDLDRRLAALQSLDALDIAAKMKLFG